MLNVNMNIYEKAIKIDYTTECETEYETEIGTGFET